MGGGAEEVGKGGNSNRRGLDRLAAKPSVEKQGNTNSLKTPHMHRHTYTHELQGQAIVKDGQCFG